MRKLIFVLARLRLLGRDDRGAVGVPIGGGVLLGMGAVVVPAVGTPSSLTGLGAVIVQLSGRGPGPNSSEERKP